MRLNPGLEALRGNPASQRRKQQAMERALIEWSRSAQVAATTAAMDRFAHGEAVEDCPSLFDLMQDPETARSFVDRWTDHFMRAIAKEPLGQIPFGHSTSPGLSRLQLLATEQATLSLVTYEEKAGSGPSPTAIFDERSQYEIVVAGTAHGYMHRRDAGSGRITSHQRSWRAGDTIRLADGTSSREICRVEGRFVVLQLIRMFKNPRPTCEYRLSDGALLHRSCADKQTSQAEMALAVLGELGRADAVPAIAELANAGPDHLRWEAARHALALDPLAGVGILDRMAANDDDPLQAPAVQLQARLKQAHPQLFAREPQSCPA